MQFRISVDDGHPEDLKVLALLEKNGLTDIATFYIAPYNHQRPVMGPRDIRDLSKKVEIGAHTLTHHWLTDQTKDQQFLEVMEGKRILEEITEKKITKFAYPRGYFNEDSKECVRLAGLKEARTMRQGVIDLKGFDDPFEVPITLHIHPNYLSNWKAELNKAVEIKGYFHITMHGWELQKYNLWENVNNIFYEIACSRN